MLRASDQYLRKRTYSGASTLVGYEIIDAFMGLADDIDWSGDAKKSYDKSMARLDSLRNDVDSRRVFTTETRLQNSGYAGDYNHEFYGDMTISVSGDKLIISRGDALNGTLNHWHYDTFRVRWDEPRERARYGKEFISFHFNAKNEVVYLERSLDGAPRYFKKKSKLHPNFFLSDRILRRKYL